MLWVLIRSTEALLLSAHNICYHGKKRKYSSVLVSTISYSQDFCYSHFFSKNISIYAIFNDQSFNDTLTNHTFSFEQLGHGIHSYQEQCKLWYFSQYNLGNEEESRYSEQ